jgi:creatinine amidohydrolase
MQLGEQNWPAAGAKTEKVVIVPLGSLEQHGHHLPLLTDSMIAGEVARRVEAELREAVLVLPTLWIGASDHHRSFPGTVSLSAETYTHVLKGLLDSLIGSGFRRILFINAHVGNVIPAQMAISDKQIEYRKQYPDLYLVFVSWFDVLTPEAIQGIQPALLQIKISHACEWETSMIQTIRPGLVGDDRPATRRHFESAFWSPDFRQNSRVSVARTLEQSSESGALGYPEKAQPEKGEALLSLSAQELAAFVREFATWPAPLGEDTLEVTEG